MAQPICIITPEGMRCLSSPIKVHKQQSECGAPDADSAKGRKQRQLVAEIRKALGPHVAAKKLDVIAKVTALMESAPVGEDTAFTIVKHVKA